MIIDLDIGEVSEGETAVALGDFDGVHIAHQALIEEVIKNSKERNLVPAVLLFKENSKALTINKKISVLMTLEQKIEAFKTLGIKLFFLKNFDTELMSTDGIDFIEEYLIKKINAKSVVCGFDYKFGKKAQCGVDDLVNYQDKGGFNVSVVEEIKSGGIEVSSSHIRYLIKDGKVNQANKLLTRPYTMTGKIVHGKKRGRELGFPTANLLPLASYVMPKDGVYKTEIEIQGEKYISATNVGANITFGAVNKTIETYIPNFKRDIYGEDVSISFLSFVRDIMMFDNKELLREQMERDVENILKLN